MLILVIPIAFLYSGQQFLSVAADNQVTLEGRRAGTLQDIFASFVSLHGDEPDVLQTEIEKISALNTDIQKFRVAKEEAGDIRVIAALDTERVGLSEENPSAYRASQTVDDESIRFEYQESGSRIWQVFRTVRTERGEVYYIFTEFSFSQLESLFRSRITEAYLLLIAVLGIVLVLAYRHLRLIDYAYLYRETKTAIETRDLFTNMVTHELRAPLTAIRGYASIIHEDSALPFDTREQAVRIQQSATRLLAIVNDLLEVARLQSGRMQIVKEQVNICETVKNVLDSLDSSAREKGITLMYDFRYQPCMLLTDPKRIHQALTNLVSNAIKYTEQGRITVVLRQHDEELQIRVQDTGMGIEADDQKKLFAPFFRVSSDRVSDITGSGLGMWITKELITLLGGTIAVESIEGVGTHVVINLPNPEIKGSLGT